MECGVKIFLENASDGSSEEELANNLPVDVSYKRPGPLIIAALRRAEHGAPPLGQVKRKMLPLANSLFNRLGPL